MKAVIRNLDPTGVEVEKQEFEIPLVRDEELGEPKTETQPNGTVITYEPARKNRYYLEIGDHVYHVIPKTGELRQVK